jgi:uncharacterized protein YjiS (DUF1127 family)
MSFISIREPAPSGTPAWLRRAAGIVRRLAAEIRRAVDINSRRRMLHQMPDYLLKDIGISRSDIDYVAAVLVDEDDDTRRRRRRARH